MWAVTLRDEYGLRVFMNTVLQKIFGSNRALLKTEEVHDLYSMPTMKRCSGQGK